MIGFAMASYDFGFMMAGLIKVKINLNVQTQTLYAVGYLLIFIDINLLRAIRLEWGGVFVFITIIRLL